MAKNLNNFRGVKIPKAELETLNKLENSLNIKFNLIDRFCKEWFHESISVFLVKNNHVILIAINDIHDIYDRESKDNFCIPDEIDNLRYLSTVIVMNKKLESLPESIGKLYSLKKIMISLCSLNSTPEALKNLTELEYVDFSDNNLKEIP